MKKLLLLLGLLVAAAPARAGIYYDLQQTASSATLRMVGAIKAYASSMSNAPVLTIDSVAGNVNASSATLTATGNQTWALTMSTGGVVNAGGWKAPWFQATSFFYGNLIGNVTGNVVGNLTGDVVGNLTGNVTGNADTATALAATPTAANSGSLCRGVTTAGNCLQGGVDALAVASSTNPARSDDLYNTKQGTSTLAAGSGISTTKSGSVWTIAFTGSAPVATYVTYQYFTTGCGTYTTPGGIKRIVVQALAGGGGGGGSTANAGVRGDSTWWDVYSSTGGAGGAAGGAATIGSAGEATGFGTPDFRVAGGSGCESISGYGLLWTCPGGSGAAPIGGGGAAPGITAVTGASALANSGGGGAAGLSQASTQVGGSGAGGSFMQITYNAPAGSYYYCVGAGGTGGSAGTVAGGNGGSGRIVVTEYYNY